MVPCKKSINLVAFATIGLCLILISIVTCNGQKATIGLNDSTNTDVVIKMITYDRVYTADGSSYGFNEIKNIDFKDVIVWDSEIVNKLYKAGVKVSVTQIPFIPKSIAVRNPETETLMLTNSVDAFQRQRTTGKVMQLISLVGNVALQVSAAKGHPPKPGIYYAVGGVGFVGFIVDIDAGRHIRFKKR